MVIELRLGCLLLVREKKGKEGKKEKEKGSDAYK